MKDDSRRMKKVSAEYITLTASQLQNIGITRARAEELAGEVHRLNEVAARAAEKNDFNGEPANFTAILAQLGHPEDR